MYLLGISVFKSKVVFLKYMQWLYWLHCSWYKVSTYYKYKTIFVNPKPPWSYNIMWVIKYVFGMKRYNKSNDAFIKDIKPLWKFFIIHIMLFSEIKWCSLMPVMWRSTISEIIANCFVFPIWYIHIMYL